MTAVALARVPLRRRLGTWARIDTSLPRAGMVGAR
jgi:hypothetical protein